MKRFFLAYTSFTRAERFGIAALCALVVVLLLIRIAMHYWVHPALNTSEEQRLQQAWAVYRRSQPEKEPNDTATRNSDEYEDASDDNDIPLPAVININTADSATLVRLKGIGPATAARIIDHRKKKGPFTSVEQLQEVSTMPKATFNLLKKHLSVTENPGSKTSD